MKLLENIEFGLRNLAVETPLWVKIVSRTFSLIAGLIGGSAFAAGYPIIGGIGFGLAGISIFIADLTGTSGDITLHDLLKTKKQIKQEAKVEVIEEVKAKIDEIQ